MEKRLDGVYTRLLMHVTHLSWKQHPNKTIVYCDLPPVSSIVRSKRVQFAGHCFRATSEIISPLVLWKPSSVGRRSKKLTYVDTLVRDTGLDIQDLKTAMLDWNCWREMMMKHVHLHLHKNIRGQHRLFNYLYRCR